MVKLILSFSVCCMRLVLDCLGPDYHSLRCAGHVAANLCDRIDLLLELLRWYCVNACLSSSVHPLVYASSSIHPLSSVGVECMGRVRMKCAICLCVYKEQRVILRYKICEVYKYVCGHCLAQQLYAWILGNDVFFGAEGFRANDRRMVVVCLAYRMSFTGILGEALRVCVDPVLSRATRGQRSARMSTYRACGRCVVHDALAENLLSHCLNSCRDNYSYRWNALDWLGISRIQPGSIKCFMVCATCREQRVFFWYHIIGGGYRYVCGHCLADDMLAWLVGIEDYPRMGRDYHRCRVIICLAGEMGFDRSFGAALDMLNRIGDRELPRSERIV